MKTKVCSKCGKELPLNNEYFNTRKSSKDGYYTYCKECHKNRMKIYYENNKEKEAIRGKIYRENNKEKIAKSHKEHYENNKEYYQKWRENNKDHINKFNKAYYQQNKYHLIERQKEYYQTNRDYVLKYKSLYYQKNKESIEKYRVKYRVKNHDKIRNYFKLYYKNNKDKLRIYHQRRKAKKNSLPSSLTEQEWIEIKNKFNNRCAYCGKKTYLEQEHFVPLSKGGEYTSNNIIPACRSCNASKRNKDFFEWYSNYKYYNDERKNKILKFIGGIKDGII